MFFVAHSENTNDLNVDYVFEKILASETFEKMLDILAMKAAEKINTHLTRKINDQDDNNFQQRKSDNRNDFQTHIDFAVVNDVLATKVPVNSKLSLKYKLFTKRAVETSGDEYRNTSSMENISNDETYHNFNLKGNNNPTNKIQSKKEETDFDESISKNTKNKDKKIGANSLALSQEGSVFDETDNKNSKYYKSAENNIEFNNNVIQQQNHSQKVVKKLEGNEKNVDDFHLKNITITQKKFFTDGDRIYALQSSSDYDEFHKELNRTRIENSSSILSA